MSIKLPTTLAEVIKISVETLQTLDATQLAALHNIATTGQTKPARMKADMILGMIKAQAKEAKKLEPVANSVKEAPVANTGTIKPNTIKPAQPTGAAAKPNIIKPAPPKSNTIKPAKKLEDMTPAELIDHARMLEDKQNKFKDAIVTDKFSFIKFEPKDLNALQKQLITTPYAVYMFMDERVDDILTQSIVVYASDKLILTVDKSRQAETFFNLEGISAMKEKAFVTDNGKFPIAFYIRTETK